MATQYNPSPNMNTGTTGWSVYGGATLTATSDGGRFRDTTSGSGRYMEVLMGEGRDGAHPVPTNAYMVVSSAQIRKNTASSEDLATITLYTWNGTGFNEDHYNLNNVVFPVGKFVELSDLVATTKTVALNGEGYIGLRITVMDGAAFDYTVTGLQVYRENERPGNNPIDANDADFTITAHPDSLTVEVDHSDPNEMVDTLRWDYGNASDPNNPYTGGAAGFRHGVETYPTAGTYTISLTASNQAGESYTTTKQVQVPSGTYQASFTHQDNFLDIDVDASSSVGAVIDTYSWDFGDGGTATGKFASHTYSQAGTYNVVLTISNSMGQTSSQTQSVVIQAAPSPGLYFTTVRTLLQVEFHPSITNGTTYSWSFGDGGTSTAVSPTYTYATAGTYSVTLTVDAATVTRDIVVNATYTPVGDLLDALRLEVEVPPAAGSLYNLAANPNGEQGGFGWVTPVGTSRIIGSNTATGTYDHGVDQWKLIYIADGSGAQYFYSEPYQVTVGQYIAAVWLNTYVDGYYRQSIEFLDGNLALVSSTAKTGYLSVTGGSARSTAALIPAGTVYARIRYDHYADTLNTAPAADDVLQITRVMLSTAATSGELANLRYAEDAKWLNVLSPSHEIKVSRSALDVGTLTATILDVALDPATASTLRPGQGVRLRAKTLNDEGNERWESVYWGTTKDVDVVYDHERRGTAKFARISLTASDNITPLASTAEPRGVSLISELPDILEGKGVPYVVNGSSDQVAPAATVALNDNASVLDQIAVTRDSELGYAWVDRNNVLVANTPAAMPAGVVTTFDEATYSDLDVSFSTQACINDVRIKWLRYTPASGEVEATTEEVLYGPYTDDNSIKEWGRHTAEFTMQGAIEDPVAIQTKATSILTANAVPEVRINSVRVPIRHGEDIARTKALIDLYDLVEVSNTDTNTLDQSRVTGIEHEITPDKWVMVVSFDKEGNVAAPQVIPPPPKVTDTVARVEALHITRTTEADTTAGNTPALRVGDTAGTHLRIDGDEVTAMTGDATQGTLYLNSGGGTRIGAGDTIKGIVAGSGAYTTDSSGRFTITHNLGNATHQIFLQEASHYGAGSVDFKVYSKGATSDVIQMHDSGTGAVLGSGTTRTVSWFLIS